MGVPGGVLSGVQFCNGVPTAIIPSATKTHTVKCLAGGSEREESVGASKREVTEQGHNRHAGAQIVLNYLLFALAPHRQCRQPLSRLHQVPPSSLFSIPVQGSQ
jgi:hypothetical protein